MRIGIDAIDIDRFTETLNNGGESFLRQNFYPEELGNRSAEHLAGIFAAKEALFKCGYLSKFDPLLVRIIADAKGKPNVFGSDGSKNDNIDVSITHTSKTAVAVAIYT